ncbi:MAG: bestrophin family ion channel [Bacteroidota bacterium]
MYTKRIYSLPAMIRWTRHYIFIFLMISMLPVILYDFFHWKWLHLPWLPIGLVGTALAFIIGFKNNASYGRLWEARKIWGGIVNASRSFAIMVNDFITNEHAKEPLSEAEFFKLRKTMIMRHVAWMTALRHALRAKKQWESSTYNKLDQEYMNKISIREYTMTLEEELRDYLTEDEKQEVLSMRNKQSGCLNLQSRHIRQCKAAGLIDDFRHVELQNMLVELFTLQGKAERIKNFPYPRQFATLNLFFIWIFVFLLPFGLMNEFDKIGLALIENMDWEDGISHLIAHHFVWLSIPFSVVISWVFYTMERIGDVSENPFEGIANDVPITSMSRAIEIDIRQMIGDDRSEIPALYEPIMDIQM